MARVSRRRSRDEEAPRSSRYVDEPDEDLEDDDDLEDDVDEDEEEEERPRRGRRGSSRSTERPARSARNRRAFDEGAEEGKNSGRGRRGSSSSRRAVEDGWGAVDKLRSQGGYAENLKVPSDDEIVIKFLDEKPFAGYREHWVQETKQPRKTYTCLGPQECPLCIALGHDTSAKILINVVEMPTGSGDPSVKVWAMGTRLAEKLKKLAEKPRTKPLNREDLYWAVSKSGKGTSTEYNLEPVKADELEDWDIEPLEDDELADLLEQKSDKSIIRWDSVEDLEELVEEIL